MHTEGQWEYIMGPIGVLSRVNHQYGWAPGGTVFVRQKDSLGQDLLRVVASNTCTESNARLIAAAPDLLAACEAEDVFWKHYEECEDCNGTTFCIMAMTLSIDALQKRKAAIARARGDE